MVVKVKESFEKTRYVKKTTNQKYAFFVEREMQNIMNEFYPIKRNLII